MTTQAPPLERKCIGSFMLAESVRIGTGVRHDACPRCGMTVPTIGGRLTEHRVPDMLGMIARGDWG